MSNAPVTFRHKDDSFDLISGLEACRDWIEAVTDENFSSDDFHTATKDGILLCKLVNSIAPGIISQVNTQNSAFSARANIEMFLEACKKLGLSQSQLFNVEDLYSGTKIRSVAVTIHWLAYVASQMNLDDFPPFDPMHLSRISLPTDQKQKLVVKKPRASQMMGSSVLSPANEKPVASNPTPSKNTVSSTPAPVATYDDYDEPSTPAKISSDLDDLDNMLNELETGSSYQAPSEPQPQSGTVAPLTSSGSIPTPVQASARTPDSPVLHRNAPPKWNDSPTRRAPPQRSNQPPPSNSSAPNASTQQTPTNAPPVWKDTPKNDPNLTQCDDCRKEIYLGQSAFSHGNGTYCRGCLCGTCGKTFNGRTKTAGDGGKNYCPDCVCHRCSKVITAQFVPDGQRKVCLDCTCAFCRCPLQNHDIPPYCENCKCTMCKAPLNGKYFPKEDGSRCCGTCINNVAQTRAPDSQAAPSPARRACKQCGKALVGSVVECNGQEYHQECFTCVECNGSAVHLLANQPYCAACHPDKECCCVCGTSLRGGGLEALGRLYHDNCFTCQRCFNPLPGGRFKEVDGFALCNNCATAVVNENIAHA